ncbi:hypothetical protein BDV96DRAFT_77181 [Lophiotrema nucula]|uniref:Secreted protein n=1 Tax=Lophiotrema nucula TaxID=690887 RepID=A0A6A5Z8H4_9PLEO|nr:hypothetical protein BDV96DRAFT_77181 [Lophiotrema nucula]
MVFVGDEQSRRCASLGRLFLILRCLAAAFRALVDGGVEGRNSRCVATTTMSKDSAKMKCKTRYRSIGEEQTREGDGFRSGAGPRRS